MGDEVHIRRHDPIDRIASDVYGHFAEHLGRCIYGGIWVGEDDRVPTEDGIRTDTVDLLADLDMPVLRWPGGCFADDYHWQDGIGEERPRRRNMWWTQGREEVPEEPNTFGTDEFIRLCEMLDTEPYLAANVGSGDPEEAVNWAEYCNYDGDTEYADMRRENAQVEAEDGYDVTYWGVGNENWGCGGRFSPSEYAEEFRQFANYLSAFDRVMNENEMELIACGHIAEEWNRKFLEQLSEGVEFSRGGPLDLLDHLSVHRYYMAGGETDFDDGEYYKLLARARQVADDVDRAAEALDVLATGHDIGIIVDEWGVWHPEANFDNGLEQENTVRDAVSAAMVLNQLNARADVVTMGNIAQTVNVLQCLVQTDEEEAWATPTYRVFDLYKEHMDATALRTVVDTDEEAVEGEEHDVPYVSASASESEDGVYVTLTNLDVESEREVTLSLDGEATVADAEVVFEGMDAAAHSTSDNADTFAADDIDVDATGDGEFVVDAPASSVVGIAFDA